MNAMRNAGPGAQAMSLTPPIARGPGEGNTLARPPSPPSLHTAAHRTPLTPDLEDQQEKGVHERRHPHPCPCYIAHSRSRGTRKGIQLPRQMLPVSSEAEKASCRLSCCSSSDAVLDVREGGRRLAALLADLKAALDAGLALLLEGRELALLLGAEAAAAGSPRDSLKDRSCRAVVAAGGERTG